jgi:hypothetical protein
MRAVTIGYRRFLGNSFNVMPTIYYKRNTGDFFNATLIYEDVGTGFRVGNEWQWENFTMGCDWFGLNYKTVEINHKEKGLGPIDTHTPMKALTMTFASFYLGYSF